MYLAPSSKSLLELYEESGRYHLIHSSLALEKLTILLGMYSLTLDTLFLTFPLSISPGICSLHFGPSLAHITSIVHIQVLPQHARP